LSDLDIIDKVSVFFPHSYNFSGEMFIVPKELVRPIKISPAEAMKFIVSGGVARTEEGLSSHSVVESKKSKIRKKTKK